MELKKTIYDYFPDVNEVWDFELNSPFTPNDFAPRSNKKVYWKCPKGHPSYLCSPDKKIFSNSNCPICSNRKVVTGINDFKTLCSKQMLDWDFINNKDIDPSNISTGSIQTVNWKCHKCGFVWKGTIKDAATKMINCPLCSRKERGRKRHIAFLNANGGLMDEKLLLDWDYSKNVKNPSEYSPHSNEYVFWKCHVCGYEWKSKISNRSSLGRGCPLCGKKKLIKGINDLETINPNLAKEWHPTKNGDLKPSDVFPSSKSKVWWLCPYGHEYQATINHRSGKNGTGCPICNKSRQTSFREQAIYFYVNKMYPDAINGYRAKWLGRFELDIFIPSIRYAIEYDGVAWHKSEKFDRERRKYKLCKEHGIRLIRVKEKMPEKLGLDLADIIISSDDFDSDKGFENIIHTVLEKICFSYFYLRKPIDVNVFRDRYEINRYTRVVKGSFAQLYPEKAKEWHPTKNGILKPEYFKAGSDFKAWWICPECGNEYVQSLAHRKEGSGCPICAQKKSVINRLNNLINSRGSISDQNILLDWNYERNSRGPEFYTSGSKEKVWWKCHKCGYEWEAKVYNRSNGRGCPKCSNLKLIVGYNDLATKKPELLKEWLYEKNVGIDPHKIHYSSTKSVWWKCSVCGYEYKAPLSRRSKGSGCRKCADRNNGIHTRELSLTKNGSIATKMPDLLKEYCSDNILPPDKVSASSHEKVHWKCSVCGHDWWTQPYVRMKGCGCPECGKKKSINSRKKKC